MVRNWNSAVEPPQPASALDPDIAFLTVGGFVYFAARTKNPLGAHSVVALLVALLLLLTPFLSDVLPSSFVRSCCVPRTASSSPCTSTPRSRTQRAGCASGPPGPRALKTVNVLSTHSTLLPETHQAVLAPGRHVPHAWAERQLARPPPRFAVCFVFQSKPPMAGHFPNIL